MRKVFGLILAAVVLSGCAGNTIRCRRGEAEEACRKRLGCISTFTAEKCRRYYHDMGCNDSMTVEECRELEFKNIMEAE